MTSPPIIPATEAASPGVTVLTRAPSTAPPLLTITIAQAACPERAGSEAEAEATWRVEPPTRPAHSEVADARSTPDRRVAGGWESRAEQEVRGLCDTRSLGAGFVWHAWTLSPVKQSPVALASRFCTFPRHAPHGTATVLLSAMDVVHPVQAGLLSHSILLFHRPVPVGRLPGEKATRRRVEARRPLATGGSTEHAGRSALARSGLSALVPHRRTP
jgi:hypothetical protein